MGRDRGPGALDPGPGRRAARHKPRCPAPAGGPRPPRDRPRARRVNGAERLLAACRRQPVDATPVWFMRQAGGSLPGYRRLRERHSVLEIAKRPALCAEVTCAAVETLGVDGAVLFADIMLPVEAM